MTNKAKKRRKELAQRLGVPRRTAANIMKGRPRVDVAMDAPPMAREVLVRRLGDVVEAHYVVLKYDPAAGHSLADAVDQARMEARRRSDLLQTAIRRMDRAGHPWICQWTRRTYLDAWTFEWMAGADDRAAAPLMLVPNYESVRPTSLGGTASRAAIDWGSFLQQLEPDEIRCLRDVFDHKAGPLTTVWGDVWDTLLVERAGAFGLSMRMERAASLLAALSDFGVLVQNGDSTSATSPSYKLADTFIASANLLGNWFDLGGLPATDQRLIIVETLHTIKANLTWFTGAAAQMNAGQRTSTRARLMGQIMGAAGRHPKAAALFELLRTEHNRGCPVEARIRVLRPGDEATEN